MTKHISLLKIDKAICKHWLNNGWQTIKKGDGEKDYYQYKYGIRTEILKTKARHPKSTLKDIKGYKNPFKYKKVKVTK